MKTNGFAFVLIIDVFAANGPCVADEILESELSEVESLRAQLNSAFERIDALEASQQSGDENAWYPRYYVDYDRGFVIRPYDPEATPFELKIGGRMQFRYTGFNRDRGTFSNQGDANRGGPLLIRNRNDFEIERSRVIFRGFMFDPKLKFFINLDADTDDDHRVRIHDFWVYYEFNKGFTLNAGKAMVPGSLDWLSLSPNTHLADRSMATTFFGPDRTIGVWANGEIADGVYYRTMLGNGFNTSDRPQSEVDERFVYSITNW